VPGHRPARLLPAALALLVGVAGLVLVLRPDAVRAAPVEPPPEPGRSASASGVEVGGVGTASGTPDVLRVTVGVEVTGDSVDDALTGADDAARRVLAALADAGVPERDVQTANVSVHPRHDAQGERITGYTARHDLSVTLRDVGTAGAVIASVADAGGDAARIEGISYALEDDAAVQEEARAAAFADAERKAEQYARLVGRELGEVLWVRENVSAPGPLPYGAADEAAAAGGSLVLAPGSTEVTVTAEVRWSLR
jgi:uncharacterized protein YggE